MRKYYNFKRLIKRYSVKFSAITLSAGYYDDLGEWVKGEAITHELSGAIISISENKIFNSNGALTAKDKQLYMLQPIDNKLHGAKVIYEGNAYSITQSVENAQFTGVYAYTLKYISAFKETSPEYNLTAALESLENRLNGIKEEAEIETTPSLISTDKLKNLEDEIERLEGVLK